MINGGPSHRAGTAMQRKAYALEDLNREMEADGTYDAGFFTRLKAMRRVLRTLREG